MPKRKPFEPKAEPAPEVVSGVAEAESLEEKVVLTVNGKPVPEEFAHLIDYKMTDQGQAEARKRDAGKRPMVEVVSDAWDKTVQRKADAEIWDSFDPLKEAVDRVREPGMNYRFLSERNAKRRGSRGWETATDKDGKPVVVAGMTLGKMPTERAEQRNQHYRDIGNDALENAAEAYEEEQAKAIRNAKVKGFAPLRRGETVADNHDHPGMVTEAGLHVSRGNGAEAAE